MRRRALIVLVLVCVGAMGFAKGQAATAGTYRS